MIGEITLVDRGRGFQLSTSRITVMDLVQYFKKAWTHDEIIQCIPALTSDEIAVVEAYYREHKEELAEKDNGSGNLAPMSSRATGSHYRQSELRLA